MAETQAWRVELLGKFSIISWSRLLGFLTCRSPKAPAARLACPRDTMTEASSCWIPSRVKTAPFPALKRGSFSSRVTA